MKRFALAAIVLMACRSSDGSARSTPSAGSASATATPVSATAAAPDSAQSDSLLQLADAGRIQGSASAPVWLVEISDFQCPFCKMWHDSIYPTIKRDYIDRGVVRMAYVHLPLNIHPNAGPAAEVSLCASVQGKFWPVHDKLFHTQERWAPLPSPMAFFDSLALSAGVREAEYRSCMRSELMRRVINGDRSRAASAGVRSTPVFYIGDEPIRGVAPLNDYRQAIERARTKSGGRNGP